MSPHDDAVTINELRLSISRLARRMRIEQLDEHISYAHLSVLLLLMRHGPRSPSELSELERVTPPSMNRTLNALTRALLVTRDPAPGDRRRVIIALTEQGLGVAEEARKKREAWFFHQVESLSASERSSLFAASDIMARLAEA